MLVARWKTFLLVAVLLGAAAFSVVYFTQWGSHGRGPFICSATGVTPAATTNQC